MNPAALLLLLLPAAPPAQEAPEPPPPLVARQWLVIAPVDGGGRRPFAPDAVFERHLLDPAAPGPRVGESLNGEKGEAQAWKAVEAQEDGTVGGGEAGPIGYAYAMLESPGDRVVLAELHGAARIFVNGEGFVGDVYRYGFRGVPVALRAGFNHLFVTGVRGSFRLRFHEPEGPLVIGGWDLTLPDLVVGRGPREPIGVLVLNASTEPVPRLVARTGGRGAFAPRFQTGAGIPPLGVLKVPLSLFAESPFRATAKAGEVLFPIRVKAQDRDETEASFTARLRVLERGATAIHTFRSHIDDSVQRYGLVSPLDPAPERPGLVVSLHGAGVAVGNQAAAYQRKPDFWILCPENRRPFGFDWQDWGRDDAVEAMAVFRQRHFADDARVYLTGHSMGGHGVWHLAATLPNLWAAIAPSAGWASFDHYTGRPLGDGKWDATWRMADGASDTLEFLEHFKALPTYILHGENDDNVPLEQARIMEAALKEAGGKPEVHVEPGAGHWWGNQCMDWPPIFELFRRTKLEPWPHEVDFYTPHPNLVNQRAWLSVRKARQYGQPVTMHGSWDPEARLATVSTSNARLIRVMLPDRRLHVAWQGSPMTMAIDLDGQRFDPAPVHYGGVSFELEAEGWRAMAEDEWIPRRGGPFKQAFLEQFVLIYGTAGSKAENRELLARARYDAEVWWYRGNGQAPVISDREFLSAALGSLPLRNVILYGNADTNMAWDAAFSDDVPFRAERGRIRLGDQAWEGPDLGALFIHEGGPDYSGLVAAFADSGVAGTRLGYNLKPFVSGVGYPDYVVFSSRVLRDTDEGVLAAGWFGPDWKLPAGR